jgi:hypothetical protein
MSESKVFEEKKALVLKTLNEHFPAWVVRDKGDCLSVEATVYRVRYPAREYKVGFGFEVSFYEEGPQITKRYGWNTPEYGQNQGAQYWAEESPPKQLKRKAWALALPKAVESLKRACELDVKLPNGLMARWCAWEESLVAWGEIPKKMRSDGLSRQEVPWDDFIATRLKEDGVDASKVWQKKLLLLRDPHPSVIVRFETPETATFRQQRREQIIKARAMKEAQK